MCLILLAVDRRADCRLILAANRDEFYQRSAAPLAYWPETPYLLAGRDLRAGGTWLGVTRRGRIAALSNYRDPTRRMENAPSRGSIVFNFLAGSQAPLKYLEQLRPVSHRYNPFNLLLGDTELLYYYSNRSDAITPISSGLYGLSNHLLDTPWPKVQRGKARLAGLLQAKAEISPDDLFGILADRTLAAPDLLPDTGVGPEWERLLAPVFVSGRTYGTRSSAVVMIKNSGRVTVAERTYGPQPARPDRSFTRTFRFTLI